MKKPFTLLAAIILALFIQFILSIYIKDSIVLYATALIGGIISYFICDAIIDEQ